LAEVQRSLVLLLAPFAPYLAHELWEMLGEKGSLLKAPWPKYDAALAREDGTRNSRADQWQIARPHHRAGPMRPKNSSSKMPWLTKKLNPAIAGKQVVKIIYVSGKLLNIVVK